MDDIICVKKHACIGGQYKNTTDFLLFNACIDFFCRFLGSSITMDYYNPIAYVFKQLPCSVTCKIDTFRDYTLEHVISVGGTPSAHATKGFTFKNCGRLIESKGMHNSHNEDRFRYYNKIYTIEWAYRNHCHSCEGMWTTRQRRMGWHCSDCTPIPIATWGFERDLPTKFYK